MGKGSLAQTSKNIVHMGSQPRLRKSKSSKGGRLTLAKGVHYVHSSGTEDEGMEDRGPSLKSSNSEQLRYRGGVARRQDLTTGAEHDRNRSNEYVSYGRLTSKMQSSNSVKLINSSYHAPSRLL